MRTSAFLTSTFLAFFQVFVCINVFAINETVLSGNVTDDRQKPLKYFTVALFSARDSSVIKGGAFTDGYFELTLEKADHYILQISCLGYKPVSRNFSIKENEPRIDIGTLVLTEDVATIGEIEVTAKRPLFTQETGKLIINVQGTTLSDAGSLVDVLKKSPGLIIDNNNNIKVFGKGAPVIYINNREVVSNDELEALQSADINKIEIDRNPSARYSAAGHAVVHIKTKRAKLDNLSWLIHNTTTHGRRFRNSTGLQMNQKSAKWANLVSYSYGLHSFRDYHYSYERQTQSEYDLSNEVDEISEYTYKIHRLFSGNDFQINEKHIFGIQFNALWNDKNKEANKEQLIKKTDTSESARQIAEDEIRETRLYNTTLSYNLNPDTLNNLSVILGYSYKSNTEEGLIHELNMNSLSDFKYNIKSNSDYHVYSVRTDYKLSLFRFITATAGGRYSNVVSNGESSSFDINKNTFNYSENSEIDDKIAAGYFQLEKQAGRFSIEGGLRFENTDSHVKASGSVIDTTYRNFFPSCSVDFNPSEKLSVNLSYSRRITRPSFLQINPNMSYMDSLAYMVGNPFLKPAYSHNIELGCTFFDNLHLTLGHTWKHNHIVNNAVNDQTNPDILVWSYNNIDNSRAFLLGATFAKSFKFYSGNVEIDMEKPYSEIPYLNSTIIRNKAMWYLSIRNEINLTRNMMLNCDFDFQSDGEDEITYFYSNYRLSAGAKLKLFKQKLLLSLTANDILNTGEANHWEDRYGTIVSGIKSDQDLTYIKVGIRYNLNRFRSSVKERSGNSEELNRL